jgi:hypothetical protein
MRPRIPADATCLYRCFALTSQRVPLNLQQLSSAAAYLLICDIDNRVVLWIGATCDDADIVFARDLGLEVFRRDQRNYDATNLAGIIWEGKEPDEPILLDYICEKCASDEAYYCSKKVRNARNTVPENQPISINVLIKSPEGLFELIEVGYQTPDEEGTIDRIPYAPIDTNTIIVSSVDSQWDVWISRGVTSEEEKAAVAWVYDLVYPDANIRIIDKSHNIRIIRQGCERVTYRRNFKVLTDYEPRNRTVPWPSDMTSTTKRGTTKRMKSKLFRLDNMEEEEDYGADVKKGEGGQFEFITEIFGKADKPFSDPNPSDPNPGYRESTVIGSNPLYHGADNIPQQVYIYVGDI